MGAGVQLCHGNESSLLQTSCETYDVSVCPQLLQMYCYQDQGLWRKYSTCRHTLLKHLKILILVMLGGGGGGFTLRL